MTLKLFQDPHFIGQCLFHCRVGEAHHLEGVHLSVLHTKDLQDLMDQMEVGGVEERSTLEPLYKGHSE